MNLVSVSIESIRIGSPLPFALRDEDGTLLANKGFVVGSRDDLEVIRGRGRNFYIDVDESDSHKRAFVGKLYELVNDESTLGEIAEARITTTDLSTVKRDTDNDPPDWLDMQVQANALLRDHHHPGQFADRLTQFLTQLGRYTRRNPDGTLFALIHLSASETRMYSATHGMLVSVMCSIAAGEVLSWPEPIIALLRKITKSLKAAETIEHVAWLQHLALVLHLLCRAVGGLGRAVGGLSRLGAELCELGSLAGLGDVVVAVGGGARGRPPERREERRERSPGRVGVLAPQKRTRTEQGHHDLGTMRQKFSKETARAGTRRSGACENEHTDASCGGYARRDGVRH